jgi:hypothetical protein
MEDRLEKLKKKIKDNIWQQIPLNDICHKCEYQMSIDDIIIYSGIYADKEWDDLTTTIISDVETYLEDLK